MAKITAIFDFRDKITRKLLRPRQAIERIGRSTEQINRIMARLNRMRINLRIRMNDRITRRLQQIRASLSRLGQRITTAVVKIKDQATPVINSIDAALGRLSNVALKVGAVAGISGGGMIFAGQNAYEMDARAAAITGIPRDYFSGTVQDIYYGNKAGTSRENVLSSLVGIGQQADLRDQALADAALYANMFSSLHPDMDINQIARAASIFYNSMQADFQRTYDSMSYVWKNGGDMADDLADTYAEYASTFAKLNISPEQLASGLIAGQKSGAWNYDVLADSVREWGIKSLTEMNEDAINAMGKVLGEKRTTELYKGILKGDITGQALLAEVATGLSKVSAADRERYGADLFGTQYEDINAPILDMATGLAEAADTAGELTTQFDALRSENPMTPINDTLSGMKSLLESIGKSIVVGLAPAFEAFNTWAASDEGQAAIANFASAVSDLAVTLGEGLVKAIQWVIENWDTLEPILKGVGAALLSLGGIVKVAKIGEAFSKAWPWISKFGKGLGGIANRIPVITVLGAELADSIKDMSWLWGHVDEIKAVGSALLTSWGNWWTDWWNDLKARWQNILGWFEDRWDWIEERLSELQGWLDGIGTNFQNFMGSLGDFEITMPTFLTGLIPGFSHAKGISDVPYDNYPANLHKGETVLPAAEAELIRQMAGQSYSGSPGGIGDIVVQITGDNHYSNDMDARKVADIAVREIEAKMRREMFTGPRGVFEI